MTRSILTRDETPPDILALEYNKYFGYNTPLHPITDQCVMQMLIKLMSFLKIV